MKILHRHLVLSFLATLGVTLLVFTFVLLMGNIFKDLVELLGNRSVGLLDIFQFMGLLLPYVLSFSMPMALLAATLLVVGRLSSEHELTAAKACGISFVEVVIPILGVAAILSFACLYVNTWLAPQSKYLFNQAFVGMAFKYPIGMFEEGQIRNFGSLDIHVGRKETDASTLHNIRITRRDGNRQQYIYAERGEVRADPKLLKIILELHQGRVDQWNTAEPDDFSERKWASTFEKYPIELDLTRLVDQRRAVKEIHHFTSTELWEQASQLKVEGIHPTPMLFEIQRRMALSVAAISFVLMGLPLGIQVQRKETSVGILISLIVAAMYYLLVLFAETLKRSPHLYPELIVWLPNLVFQAVGIWMIWRQQKI